MAGELCSLFIQMGLEESGRGTKVSTCVVDTRVLMVAAGVSKYPKVLVSFEYLNYAGSFY